MMAADPAYPFAGNPRVFRAAAMPNGDARFGVAGPLVFLCEQRGHCADRVKYLTRVEAEQLLGELQAALRAFDWAEELTDRPRAYTGPYPIRGATLAEVG